MIEIGQTLSFKPCVFYGEGLLTAGLQVEVTGTVVYINRKHGWYRVRYRSKGTDQHECFFIQAAEDRDAPRYTAHHKGPRK